MELKKNIQNHWVTCKKENLQNKYRECILQMRELCLKSYNLICEVDVVHCIICDDSCII